jgi:hypothetical protein
MNLGNKKNNGSHGNNNKANKQNKQYNIKNKSRGSAVVGGTEVEMNDRKFTDFIVLVLGVIVLVALMFLVLGGLVFAFKFFIFAVDQLRLT